MQHPVENLFDDLDAALIAGNVILEAPTGAGKSTVLPLHLLRHPRFQHQQIIMLQPRRVAVRAIAHYLAQQWGDSVGETIGYQVRGESCRSDKTRLLIVTEGLLTRRLQADPTLDGVGLVIFDEFHERNIHSDLSFAFALEAQQGLREDLRLLVMSATLDSQGLKRWMPDATELVSEGRSFPVCEHYRPWDSRTPLAPFVATLVGDVLNQHPGDVLVFLPGRREIDNLREALKSCPQHVDVVPLYGALSVLEQSRAIAPSPPGRRKVVLSTNIAQTSLTLEGIVVVIDVGLEKQLRFDLRRGLPILETQRISQAASVQRAGRAGRVQPGHCYRLWPQEQQSRMAQQDTPDMLRVDVSGVLLDIASWGSDLSSLALLDPPRPAQLRQAYDYLQHIGAMDERHKLTPLGRQMVTLGCEPRLAKLLLEARQHGDSLAALACCVCALLEGDSRGLAGDTGVLSVRLKRLLDQSRHPLHQQAKRWAKRLGVSLLAARDCLEEVDRLLAIAFDDWLAQPRSQGLYRLANGTGAQLRNADQWPRHDFLLVAELQLGKGADAQIYLAEPLTEQRLKTLFATQLQWHNSGYWDPQRERIVAEQRQSLGSIVLNRKPAQEIADGTARRLLGEQIRQHGLAWCQWPANVEAWWKRARFMSTLADDWPSFAEADLLDNLEQWLLPYVDNVRSRKQLQQLDWLGLLKARLAYAQLQQMDAWLPERLAVASGHQHALEYRDDGSVHLAVRIQEMYGTGETPRVANGRVPVSLVLLSPARRPLQTTQDLAGFWQGSYKAVQKEMKGRYPKHFWPDDPASATATTRTKRAM
ncbi:ATP-dependent helicase HrpB [Aestuariibacter halophilus]|uniref:ATP-dependent helicase HrpB n=1 Tax=Fluctibacter halophilus TaxID=226011 RepID=A0ABS8GC76_9ALTE|nr:ATP-dependent helicase HrpB [Aestuariibacter halophilus]MCC2617415.1 ATP-dependent helicase HrpB [Aestuariibacter halophilus]